MYVMDLVYKNSNDFEMADTTKRNHSLHSVKPVPKETNEKKRLCTVFAGIIIASLAVLAIIAVIAIVVFRPSTTVAPTETSSQPSSELQQELESLRKLMEQQAINITAKLSGSSSELRQELESLRKLMEQQAINITATTKEVALQAVILSKYYDGK